MRSSKWLVFIRSRLAGFDRSLTPVKASPGVWTANELAWFTVPMRLRIEQVFRAGYRLAQEFVGTDYLQGVSGCVPAVGNGH
jgi:hypothetical protein